MNRYLIIVLLIASVGCGEEDKPDTVTFTTPLPTINWKQEANSYTDQQIASVRREIDAVRSEVRRIPEKPKFGIQTVSYSKPLQDLGLIDNGDVEIIDGTDEIKALTSAVNSLPKPVDHSADIKALTDAVSALTRKSQSAPIAATYSAAPQAPTYASAPPVSYQSAPTTYASGPKTYGNTRPGGYKTVRKTRRVARTVYDEVPYEEQVAVAVRDVYQTIQEQVPVSVTKTRMRTEQRTRKVPKTVLVDEPYSVQVPEQYSETVMQTRPRRVKVGTEQVAVSAPAPQPVSYSAAPVRCEPAPVSYSVAPTPVYAAPPSYAAEPCVECTPAPSYSAAPTYAAAPVFEATYSAEPCVSNQYSTPSFMASTPRAAAAPPMFYNVSQAQTPQSYSTAAPVLSSPAVQSPQTFSTFAATPAFQSATPSTRSQLMMSTPVATAPVRAQRLRPFATAAQSYSQVRTQNKANGGGLFQLGKPQTCVNGQCGQR